MIKGRIAGIGSYVPENVLTNEDLSKLVDTSDEWIYTRTGISNRRITKEENTSDLAAKAAEKALENAKISPLEIDLIIVATTSPDALTPATAAIVQNKIGAKNSACFDVLAACTGFIYGLKIANSFIKSGDYNNILVIGAEALSKIIDWKDRNTCVLFGDGAGAIVLSKTSGDGISSVDIGTDGEKNEYILCKSHPINNPINKVEKDILGKMSMNGKEVFKFAVNIIPRLINKLLEDNNIKIQELDYIVPHQANNRIIELAAKKLDVDVDKFYMNLEKYGNTSSASIPLALDEMNKKGLLKNGQKLALVGFGGGLTYGSSLIIWNKN
ncbi:MAG: beta-ketoacyl-ACP synthase III [Clostridiaceae bacterium]